MYFHVWFGTKYRRRILVGEIAPFVENTFRDIATQKGFGLFECACFVDHAHLMLNVNDRGTLSRVMQLLKGGAAFRTFREFPELKLDARSQNLWREGFGSRVVPLAQLSAVGRYIRTQAERPEKFDGPYAKRRHH